MEGTHNNRFRAQCSNDCPVFADMQVKFRARASEALHPRPVPRPQVPLIEPVLPVKKVYREQFETGLRLALEEVQKGTKLRRIVEFLNERGLETRTGRQWKYAILRNELRNIRSNLKAETPSRTGAE